MTTTGQTFATYFAFAVDAICKVLWREGVSRGPQELVRLTGNRIRRLERRFNALVARWRAGTLAAQAAPPPRPSPAEAGEGEAKARGRVAWTFPRGRGWVLRLLAPVTGQPCVGALYMTWEAPEMKEFYAAAPQVGKILRPLADMIGAPVPEWLKLPKRRRVRKKDTSPRPSPQSGEGVWARRDAREAMIVPNRRLPAKEQAEDAMRRSEASGKPIALRKFLPAAFGYWAHPPRDGNCPPPEIGYGGRLRPLPKDYKPPPDD